MHFLESSSHSFPYDPRLIFRPLNWSFDYQKLILYVQVPYFRFGFNSISKHSCACGIAICFTEVISPTIYLSQTKENNSINASPLFYNTQANAAGNAYQTLFKQTWRTHETRTLTNHNPVNIRGFKGDYTINVKKNGHVIETENFTLGDSGTSLELHLPSHGTLYCYFSLVVRKPVVGVSVLVRHKPGFAAIEDG